MVLINIWFFQEEQRMVEDEDAYFGDEFDDDLRDGLSFYSRLLLSSLWFLWVGEFWVSLIWANCD